MKLGHYNSLLAASLFAFVGLCPFVGFSECGVFFEGGQYVIRCWGIIGDIPTVTNEVYIIKDCEDLKRDLLFSVGDISTDLGYAKNNYNETLTDFHSLYRYLDYVSSDERSSMDDDLQRVEGGFQNIIDSLDHAIENLNGPDLDEHGNDVSLRAKISSIECGSCSTNDSSGGSCSCNVDFSEILDKLNEAQRLRITVTNSLSFIASALGSYSGGSYLYRFWRMSSSQGGTLTPTLDWLTLPNSYSQRSILNVLNLIDENLAKTQSAMVNYLYKITELQLPSISNHVEHLDNEFTDFSFFVKQKSPLHGHESPEEGYYSYLTNFYLSVSFGRVSSAETRTNWFSRIETLLASLVFADAPANQLQEDTSAENAVERIGDSLTSLNDAPSSQLTTFEDASRSVVDSIQSFSGIITDVTKPSTIVLVRQSSGGGGASRSVSPDGDFTIEFQSSEIDSLVEACRCATTLAWTFGGLFLAYWFIHWCLMTSYKLVVFCYSVLSSIFGRS